MKAKSIVAMLSGTTFKKSFSHERTQKSKIVKNNKRIYFSETSRIKGSISLLGARFDDVILKDYKDNIKPDSKQVTLLSPNNTLNPYFVELGWMSQENINLPNSAIGAAGAVKYRNLTVSELISDDRTPMT